ncbi:IS1096 element passenger TnpR family protein [Schleiferilactobacillus shenzhenensis]|nr:DUF2785 domain-containing protein [Schleiferilactobacillus shenzhenensis]
MSADKAGKTEKKEQYLQLKITLEANRPPVWRRVVIPADSTLADLRRVLRIVFDLAASDEQLTTTAQFAQQTAADGDEATLQPIIHQAADWDQPAAGFLHAQALYFTFPSQTKRLLRVLLESVLGPAEAGPERAPYVAYGRQAMTRANGGQGRAYHKKVINAALAEAFPDPRQRRRPLPVIYADPDQIQRDREQPNTPEGQMQALSDLMSGKQLTTAQSEALAAFFNDRNGVPTPHVEKPKLAPGEKVTQEDIDDALARLGSGDIDGRSSAVNMIIQGFADGEFTRPQRQRTATRLMAKNRLFQKLGEPEGDLLDRTARGDTATIYAGMLVGDMMDPFLTGKQRTTLFHWASEYLQKEIDLGIIFPGNLTATSCGLRFLYSVVMHPDFPAGDLLKTLIDSFELLLSHMQLPFQGDEAESMALIVHDLVIAKMIQPADFLTLLHSVTGMVERYLEPTDPRSFYRRKGWVAAVEVLFISLDGADDAYGEGLDLVFDIVDRYYQSMGIDIVGDDDDEDDADDDGSDDDAE